jgi:hypothetical protein
MKQPPGAVVWQQKVGIHKGLHGFRSIYFEVCKLVFLQFLLIGADSTPNRTGIQVK